MVSLPKAPCFLDCLILSSNIYIYIGLQTGLFVIGLNSWDFFMTKKDFLYPKAVSLACKT